MKKLYPLSVVATFLLGGCALGPDYVRPTVVMPDKFNHATTDLNRSFDEVDTQWWRSFGDESLTQSVEKGMKANYDIAIAQTQLQAVMGQYEQTRSYLYPHINATASFDRKNVENSTLANQPNGLRSTLSGSLALVSYEIDLFGKVRRGTEAVEALLKAGDFNKRAVSLSVSSQIVASYIRLASLTQQIELQKQMVKVWEESEKLAYVRFQVGAINEADVANVTAQLKGVQSTLTTLEASLIAEQGVYGALRGEHASTFQGSSLDRLALPEVPVGLPSTILQARPDILMYEQNLMGANAKIGVAYANYFPSFSLTGMLGLQSNDFSSLLNSPARLWQITPALNLPIVSAGLLSGQVKVAEAQRDEALLGYKKGVMSALNDVDATLGAYHSTKKQWSLQQQRTDALRKGYENSVLRYEQGMISYTELLSAQYGWLSAKQQEGIAHQNALLATVSLYKALGGGWKEFASGTRKNISIQ